MRISRLETPIGAIRLASTAHGLAYLELPHASGRGLEGWLRRYLPQASCADESGGHGAAAEQLREYLEGRRERFELPLDLRGTDFQRKVWGKLLEIPYGETRSYGQLARAVGRPRAVRAVGAANGANPVSLVVPCHRVIAHDGSLGGYGGGSELKARLLAMERARRPEGLL